MLAFMVTATPSLTIPDCAADFVAAQLNFRNFDKYDTWFDDNSTMTLAQTGVYSGVDDILEYSKFIFPGSPYVAANGLFRSENSFVSLDPVKRSCVFKRMNHNRYQHTEMAGNALYEANTMFTVEWRFDDKKVGKVNVYYDPSFLGYFFSALSTPAVDNFVCKTMRDSCPAVWAANELTNIGECEAKLAALPLAEGEYLYVDGNTKSCRKLHAVFAVDNAHHCAHLSFKPMADPKGKIKCQESAQQPISDLFSDDDLAKYAAFVAEEGFDSDQKGWRLSPCEAQADCPMAGDMEEHPKKKSNNSYTVDAKCVFGTPTERRLLFGPTPVTPKAGVCVP